MDRCVANAVASPFLEGNRFSTPTGDPTPTTPSGAPVAGTEVKEPTAAGAGN